MTRPIIWHFDFDGRDFYYHSFHLNRPPIMRNALRWILYNSMFDAELCRKVVELVDNEKFNNMPKLQAIHEAILGTYKQGQGTTLLEVIKYIRTNELDVTAYELVTLANDQDVSNWIGLAENFNNKIITKLM